MSVMWCHVAPLTKTRQTKARKLRNNHDFSHCTHHHHHLRHVLGMVRSKKFQTCYTYTIRKKNLRSSLLEEYILWTVAVLFNLPLSNLWSTSSLHALLHLSPFISYCSPFHKSNCWLVSFCSFIQILWSKKEITKIHHIRFKFHPFITICCVIVWNTFPGNKSPMLFLLR